MPVEVSLTGAVVAILILGSFVQGLTGFGLALVSVPLLSLLLDVKTAVPLAGLFGWLVTFPLVYAMRAHIRWRTGLILFAASLPGTWLGAELLQRLPGGAIRAAMGVVLIVSSLHALRSREPVLKSDRLPLALGAGFCSGALGAAVGEPGPPVIAYTSLVPWSSDEAKSTLAFFFMLQMMGALASFWQKGLLTAEVFGLFLPALPGFVLGLGLGMAAYAVIRGRKLDFHKFVHLCLLAIGVVLIVKAAA
jgi:uncharacterized membrane protein YfcA